MLTRQPNNERWSQVFSLLPIILQSTGQLKLKLIVCMASVLCAKRFVEQNLVQTAHYVWLSFKLLTSKIRLAQLSICKTFENRKSSVDSRQETSLDFYIWSNQFLIEDVPPENIQTFKSSTNFYAIATNQSVSMAADTEKLNPILDVQAVTSHDSEFDNNKKQAVSLQKYKKRTILFKVIVHVDKRYEDFILSLLQTGLQELSNKVHVQVRFWLFSWFNHCHVEEEYSRQ